MSKSIIKEIIIVLLLTLAIILVLGILLYEYVPISKTIPNEVAYTMPEDAKKELQQASELDESQVVMTYEVTSSDLSNYRSTKNYNPGRANPFASTVTASGTNATTGESEGAGNKSGESNRPQGNSENGNSGNSNSENSNTSGSTSSGGRFFKDTGTK